MVMLVFMQTNESYFAEVFNKLLYLRRVRYYAKVATLLTKMYNYHPLTNNMARFLAIVNVNKILFEFLDLLHSHAVSMIFMTMIMTMKIMIMIMMIMKIVMMMMMMMMMMMIMTTMMHQEMKNLALEKCNEIDR
ncbi:hypothetical protein V1478_014187 [Vespula squamosa]|uniref:Uncharacterized protein n=1 Tax=Vespula squamosa TaxID=30214 RepID=A0ABD2A805_VESSQ